MTGPAATSDAAFRVAERLRTQEPWEVYAERSRRYEVHLGGRTVQMVRGPITLEGYGIRLLRARDGKVGTGFQASTDFSDAGIQAATADAEAISRNSVFPAKRVELPGPHAEPRSTVEILDRALWDDPLAAIERHVAELFRGFDHRKNVAPSFGSVRATLSETSIANSAGLRAAYPHTVVEFEVAVKAFGGPEGAAPGEYWVNSTRRRLETERLSGEIDDWCRFAQDARRGSPPPSGDLPVVLPPEVLAGILPTVIGYRCTGAAELRKLTPKPGDAIGAARLTMHDDGRVPWAIASAPVDGEGTVRGAHPLVDHGAAGAILYDALHAGAFDRPATGSASRGQGAEGFVDWRGFTHPPRVSTSTLSIAPGDGGSDAELAEIAGDGVWVQQFGWAIPDPISGAFGGEIRVGYRIRHGKIAEPIRGGTVGGVVLAPPGQPSLLRDVAAIGGRSALVEGVSTPALLIRPLVVAGAGGPGPTSSAK